MMKMTLLDDALERYILKLITLHFPDESKPCDALHLVFKKTLERVEYCFSHIQRKYYFEKNYVIFDHLNADHMATLLYFLANTVWRETGDTELATRLFYLNKILHGLDLYYSVSMPDIFMLVHPLGTVLGKASYQNFLVVYQNVTVGTDATIYPQFGEGTILYSRSSVVGNCVVGNNVVFSANSFLLNRDVAPDSIVLGQYPKHRFISNKRSVRSRCFDAPVLDNMKELVE